jgi:asparagine synthase (glutamine-hydrolysing)
MDDANGHKLWLRAAVADVLPDDVLNRPKQGFVTPTREWMTAVIDRYRPMLVDGALVQRNILDGARLRRWIAAPPSLHRDFFQYKLTQLELWTRLVVEGHRTAEMTYAPQRA